MFQFRQVRVRLRAGDSVREIARSGLMGRDKLGELRAVAQQQGWLDVGVEVPGDEAIATALGLGRQVASSTISSVEPHRDVVKRWHQLKLAQRWPQVVESSGFSPEALPYPAQTWWAA